MMATETGRLAAVGDLHCTKRSDAMLPCWPVHSGAVWIPSVAVLGNHDVDAGKEEEVRQILTDAGDVM